MMSRPPKGLVVSTKERTEWVTGLQENILLQGGAAK